MTVDFIDILEKLNKLELIEARVAQLEKEVESNARSEDSKYMTIKEAAAYLSVSRVTIHRYCKAGDLKKHRMPGGQPRLLREDVENYLSKLPHSK